MDPEEYRKKIELDILAIIEEKLRNGQMDVARAKAIARMTLDKLHPPISLEQIYEIAPQLDDEFIELSKAVLPVVHDHDEKVREIVSKHAEELIRNGKFEEAHSILIKATGKKGTSD